MFKKETQQLCVCCAVCYDRKPAQSKSDCSMESTQPAVAEHLSNSFWVFLKSNETKIGLCIVYVAPFLLCFFIQRGQSTELQVEKTQKYSSVLVLGLLLTGGTKYIQAWVAEQDSNITSKRLRQCSCMISNFTLLILACDLIPTLAHRKICITCTVAVVIVTFSVEMLQYSVYHRVLTTVFWSITVLLLLLLNSSQTSSLVDTQIFISFLFICVFLFFHL